MSKYGVRIGILAAIATTLFVIFLIQSPSTQRRHEIRVGVLPDVAKSELHKRYSHLLDHLSQETGLKFQLVTPSSYQHLLRLFADREVDMAYFGGLTFVRSQKFYNARPLVMRAIDTRFTSYFVVRANGPLQDCDDLRCDGLAGKVISFGSKLSTSGHLMPRHFLNLVKGVKPETYFEAVRYSGAHDQTALLIRDGKADVGVLNSEIFRSMQKEGRLKQGELRIIWETPPYPDYVWAIQSHVGEILETTLRNAFLMLDISNETHAAILSPMGAQAFLPAGTAEFRPLKEIAETLGFLIQD